jgi:hypothetical protein
MDAPESPFAWCVLYLLRWGASMKPRHPKLDWIKTVLADHRDDPQNAAPADEFAVASSEPAPTPPPAGNSGTPIRP